MTTAFINLPTWIALSFVCALCARVSGRTAIGSIVSFLSDSIVFFAAIVVALSQP